MGASLAARQGYRHSFVMEPFVSVQAQVFGMHAHPVPASQGIAGNGIQPTEKFDPPSTGWAPPPRMSQYSVAALHVRPLHANPPSPSMAASPVVPPSGVVPASKGQVMPNTGHCHAPAMH